MVTSSDRTVTELSGKVVRISFGEKRDVAGVFGINQPVRPGMTECFTVFEQRRTTPFCNIEVALLDTTFTMDMGMR